MLVGTRTWWVRRRGVAALVAAPMLASGYVVAAGAPVERLVQGWSGLGWTVLAAGAALLGAVVVASYLPTTGRRPELGCTPCAAVAGLSLVGSILAIATYAASPVGPALAVAVTLFGLAQRLGPAAGPGCAVPARDGGGGRG